MKNYYQVPTISCCFLGVLFVVGSFCLQKMKHISVRGDCRTSADHATEHYTVDEMTKEYVFLRRAVYRGKIYALLFILSILALKCMKMAS